MAKRKGPTCIGILTSGGDCQGLNAAIRAVAKAAISRSQSDVLGILDGFRGLVENRSRRLADDELSGILTRGGTILGTSRDKPDKFPVGDQVMDMTLQAVENYHRMHLDYLVCLGGGGTQKNALRLIRRASDLRVLTLPKTIDNDVAGTDVSFGFDTAVQIATEAIDRVHSTASSHQRVMVVEIMGHRTGWLAASAGLAGGADVILIPEIPYDIDVVVDSLVQRSKRGKKFSIIAVAEGATSRTKGGKEAKSADKNKAAAEKKKAAASDGAEPAKRSRHEIPEHMMGEPVGVRIAREIQQRTGLQTRLTTLGHTQRGGTPSAFDRILATKLGTRAAELMEEGAHGVMVAVRGEELVSVPLEEVAGKRKCIPLDHSILRSLRDLRICLGDAT
jgi:6-phosphofructokinase 1